MKLNEKFWMKVLQVIAAMITAAVTTLTTVSCMGLGPLF